MAGMTLLCVESLRLGLDYLGGKFKAGMRLFGWQFQGWEGIIWLAVLRLRLDYFGRCFKAGMRLFGWPFLWLG